MSEAKAKKGTPGTFTWAYWGSLGLGVALTLAGFILAFQFVEPAPPDRLVLATGLPSGAYAAFGSQYQAVLAESGIEVVLENSAGSVENLDRLTATQGGADVAFVQGGAAASPLPTGLATLASLYWEPIWVFLPRNAAEIDRLSALRGKRIGVGALGSGVRAAALELLAENGVTEESSALAALDAEAGAAALRAGAIDALFIVSALESPTVQALLTDPTLRPMHFARAEALARIHPEFSLVRLPEGAIDLVQNIPNRSLTLPAPAATLVAREELHPALIELLLAAARRIHHRGGLLEETGAFPSLDHIDFPPSPEAQRYLRDGPSFLQRYLPFWAANLADRLKVLLLPLITLMFPLAKILPPVYRWRIRSSIYRWYRELRDIDAALFEEEGLEPEALETLAQRLNALEAEVAQLSTPLSYADAAYTLRLHIELVSERLQREMRALQEGARLNAADPGGCKKTHPPGYA